MNFRSGLAAALASSVLMATFVADAQQVIYRATPQTVQNPVPATPLSLSAWPSTPLGYGQDWNLSFVPSGGRGPYSTVLTGGTPPPGVTASAGSSVVLSGRSGAGSHGPFSARVVDSTGASAEISSGTVVVGNPSPITLAASSTTFRFPKNLDWNVPFIGTGGLAPYAFSVPAGLAVASRTATGIEISGGGTVGTYQIPSIGITDALGTTGTPSPTVTVTVGAAAALVPDRTTVAGLDAGPASSVAGSIVVTNSGDFASTSAPTVAVASGPFSIFSSDCTSPLAGGSSCTAVFKASASTDGPLAGTATIAGVAGMVQLAGTASGYPRISTSISSTTLDPVAGTAPGACRDLVVANSGSGAGAAGLSTVFSGSDASAFETCTPSTAACQTDPLAGGSQCRVGVRLKGTANGTFSATVTVSSGGSSSTPLSLNGTVSGVIPACSTALAARTVCTRNGRTAVVAAAGLYVNRCDAPRVWNASLGACTGSSQKFTYANAAPACGGSGGYLPSKAQLESTIMPVLSYSDVDFRTGEYYWSSTEDQGSTRTYLNIVYASNPSSSDSSNIKAGNSSTYWVRCVLY